MPSTHVQRRDSPLAAPVARTLRAAQSLAKFISTLNVMEQDSFATCCACMQDSVNQLLQQYVMHLIQTEQHELVPIYACHMRQDVRRITYASYFHSLTQRDMADCHAVYRSAWESFRRWPRGDINGETELDDIVEQVSPFLRKYICIHTYIYTCIHSFKQFVRQLNPQGVQTVSTAFQSIKLCGGGHALGSTVLLLLLSHSMHPIGISTCICLLTYVLVSSTLHMPSAVRPDVLAVFPSVHAQPEYINKLLLQAFPPSFALSMVMHKHDHEMMWSLCHGKFAVRGPGDGGKLLGNGQGPQPVGSHSQVAGLLRLHSATRSQGSKQSAAAAVFGW